MKIKLTLTDEDGVILDQSSMEVESFVTRLEVTPKGGLDLTGSEHVELVVPQKEKENV